MRVFWRLPLAASLALAVFIAPVPQLALAKEYPAKTTDKTSPYSGNASTIPPELVCPSWKEAAPTAVPPMPQPGQTQTSRPAPIQPAPSPTDAKPGQTNASQSPVALPLSTEGQTINASDATLGQANNPAAPQFNTTLLQQFPNKQWWLKFNDPYLETYIGEAVQNNPRLEASMERIKQARAQVSIAFAKQLPSLSFSPQYLRAGLPSSLGGGLPSVIQAFVLSFAPAYEVDLFGKNRNKTQSAKKELEAVELDSKALLISLQGEVATAYFNLLRVDELVASQDKNLALLKRINALKRNQYQAGLTTYDDVVRSERDVAQALTNMNGYRQQQAMFSHQLAVLVGRPPETQANLPRGALSAIALPTETETGIPSELVLRRPDIAAGEQRLQKAAIDVKVARKAFLPSVKLSAMLTTAGEKIGDVVNMNNFADIEMVQINQPIFQGGRLIGESKLQKARQREQVANYRQAILTAMKEVEDQLSVLKSNYENLNSNSQRLDLTQHSLRITESQQQQGLIPRLTVLQAQSELIQYQQLSAASKADAVVATVNLFKALGGGY